jgi:glutathione S-transferase
MKLHDSPMAPNPRRVRSFLAEKEIARDAFHRYPKFGAIAKQRAEETLALLDGVLAHQRFIAGDRFSIADITALVGVDFGRVVRLRPTPEQKNVLRWHAELSARPSATA